MIVVSKKGVTFVRRNEKEPLSRYETLKKQKYPAYDDKYFSYRSKWHLVKSSKCDYMCDGYRRRPANKDEFEPRPHREYF